jgi:hypothetical protein
MEGKFMKNTDYVAFFAIKNEQDIFHHIGT